MIQFEQKRGHDASAAECLHGATWCALRGGNWLNERFLKPTDVPIPTLVSILNLTRLYEFLYNDGDRFMRSYLMKEQVALKTIAVFVNFLSSQIWAVIINSIRMKEQSVEVKK